MKAKVPKKYRTRRKSSRPKSASNGNMYSLSTEQLFAKMKNHRAQRRKSVIPSAPSKKSTPKRMDERAMRAALDYSYTAEQVIIREKSNNTAVSTDTIDSQNFNAPEMHEKAVKNRMLAKVR